jgi:hypothetical protein
LVIIVNNRYIEKLNGDFQVEHDLRREEKDLKVEIYLLQPLKRILLKKTETIYYSQRLQY